GRLLQYLARGASDRGVLFRCDRARPRCRKSAHLRRRHDPRAPCARRHIRPFPVIAGRVAKRAPSRYSIRPRVVGMKLRILLVFSLLLAAGTARAQSPEWKAAQAAFDQGQVAYLQGNYDDAAAAFKKAYESRRMAQFLF